MLRTAAVVIATLALSCGVLAQNKNSNEQGGTRSVQGAVTDGSGSLVANAAVLLKNTKTLQIRSFKTSQDGRYHFAGLSPNDDYELKADFEGATSGWKRLSVFNTRKVATIGLKLKK